jgi:hypothetical protein
MITGYNTDVSHRDVVLHVQTEDKGLANPFIESLVYVGGRVLVAKRASYADILAGGSGEKEIVALMDRQHRTMIAAIRHGRFDDKLSALLGDATLGTGTRVASRVEADGGDGTATALAAPPLPGPPVAEPLPSDRGDRTLDQVILEYLAQEAEQEQLVLMLQESHGLALGEHASLELHARSSKTGRGVDGTSVTVKMISTASEPRVLSRADTDDDGVVRLDFDIPRLARGTSALIITAASPLGRAELKQLL